MAKIILKNIGRGKVNKEIEVDTSRLTVGDVLGSEANTSEERLAEMALIECKKHVMSSDVWLEPDDTKGDGFWQLHVGMGYHVGDVEIVL